MFKPPWHASSESNWPLQPVSFACWISALQDASQSGFTIAPSQLLRLSQTPSQVTSLQPAAGARAIPRRHKAVKMEEHRFFISIILAQLAYGRGVRDV